MFATAWVFRVLLLLAVHTVLCSAISLMRAAKCVIPNGLEHVARAAFLQQCVSKNYAQGNETQCYDELGCFPMDAPWTSLLRPLPSPYPPAEVNTQMYCYTRECSKRHNVTLWPDVKLDGCEFDPSRKTVFITHGFVQDGNYTWLAKMKDMYLKNMDANVFIVDWGQGATTPTYFQGASNTRIAGAEIARFIKHLESKHGLKAKDVHLIGHSLGAQVMSYAAKRVPGIGHFTALEPAQPAFEGCDSTVRVDKSDADYVEVVHTNAAPFIPNLGFGMMTPQGHSDFYINGGVHQPGCPLPDHVPQIKSIEDLATFPYNTLYQLVFCSHTRAYEYYMRVLDPNCIIWGRKASFVRNLLNAGTMGLTENVFKLAQKCDSDSCLPLGLNTPHAKARGVFAATTTMLPPYCETNPEVNGRLLREIEEKKGGLLSGISDGVHGAVDKAHSMFGTGSLKH